MSESIAKKIRQFGKEEIENLKEVVERGDLSFAKGGFVERFEDAFAKYTGAKKALAKANGMLGLAEAVSVSGANTGTEVICDPIVHFGALATAYFNAVPRFADVSYDTYNMDPDSLEANITENTRAVIVTHLWGLCAEIDRIRDICKKNNLFLIEDCAHAINSYWKGKHAGTFGDIGVFSFQEYKQLSTGDGAMSILNDEKLAEKIESIWAFSGESPYFMTLNYRMNETTAALGLAQLGKVNERIKNLYDKTLEMFNKVISDCQWLKNRVIPADAIQSGYWFACTWEGDKFGLDYNRFKKMSEEMGIGLRFGFNEIAPYEYDLFKKPTLYKHSHCPTLCPFYTEKSDYRYKKGLCPVTEDLMPRLVTVNLILMTMDEAKEKTEKLSLLIEKMNK